MLTFALAVFFLIVTPGPGVLSLAGVGSAFGYRDGARYLIGLFIGTNLVCAGVISGLAAILFAVPEIRVLFTLASMAYILWLAFKIAFAGARVAFIERVSPPGIKGGILLQAINPKAYAVNTALFTGFVFMADNPALEITLKLIILNVIWLALHVLWLWFGVTLRRLNLSAGAQRRINYAMAASMLVVVVLAVFAAL